MKKHLLALLYTSAMVTLLPISTLAQGPEEEITGTLTILHMDGADHKKSKNLFFLEEDSTSEDKPGRKFEVHFDKDPKVALTTGQKIKIKGSVTRGKGKGNATTTPDLENMLALNTSGQTGTVTTGAPLTFAATGVQQLLTMQISFPGDPNPCTTDSINSLLFTSPTSVNSMYQQSSNGKVSFAGQVVPVTIDNTVTSCDGTVMNWVNAADAAAAAKGVNLSAYPHRLYLLPESSRSICPGYAGTSSGPSNPTLSFAFGGYACGYDGSTMKHELGHALGMWHASTGALPNVNTGEYGDTSDVMGTAWGLTLQHNAPHKVEMGWLPPTQVQTVTQSGTYTISALENVSGTPLALKIAKPDSGGNYYLSMRAPLGFDQMLPSQYHNTLSIHHWAGGNSFLVGLLADGQNFSDLQNEINISQVSHDSATNTVTVSVTLVPDTTAPTTPWNLTASKSSQTIKTGGRGKKATTTTVYNIALSWVASNDNKAVAGYRIYQNGSQVASTSATSYLFSGLPVGTFTYTVAAYDAAGNMSAQSTPLVVKTP